MRNISFALTEPQFRARTKTVTRRLRWETLKPGTLLRGVRKAMGLKPGEKIVPLGVIRVINVRREPLSAITKEECVREGFPDLDPVEFIEMFKHHMGCMSFETVTRIEFEYVEEEAR